MNHWIINETTFGFTFWSAQAKCSSMYWFHVSSDRRQSDLTEQRKPEERPAALAEQRQKMHRSFRRLPLRTRLAEVPSISNDRTLLQNWDKASGQSEDQKHTDRVIRIDSRIPEQPLFPWALLISWHSREHLRKRSLPYSRRPQSLCERRITKHSHPRESIFIIRIILLNIFQHGFLTENCKYFHACIPSCKNSYQDTRVLSSNIR